MKIYFKAAYAVARTRPGPTGPFLDGFTDSLRAAGYADRTACGHLRAAAHLGVWMQAEDVALAAVDDRALDAFTAHLSGCTCVRSNRGVYRDARAGARVFLAHLRDLGVVPLAPPPGDRLPAVVEQFQHWMLRHRGVMASTLRPYRPFLVELVQRLGDPARYTADALRRFVAERAARHSLARAKQVVSAVRMFLRFLAAQGLCDVLLVEAIPTIAHWRLASLPAYLSPADVERVVGAPDPTTPLGRRDRAMLLLLARLGLRAGDVAGLRLGDIDWSAGMLHVAGKGRHPGRLPLPQEVGDAVLDYLVAGRPRTNTDHVFVGARAPHRALRHSAAISEIVNRAAERVGVVLPRGGAHVLRHSLATALVRGGVPFPVVRAVLRHRSDEMTAYYAKVDVGALRKIAQPWPLVSPC